MTTPTSHLKRAIEALEIAKKSLTKQVTKIEIDNDRENQNKHHMSRLRSAGTTIARAANYEKASILAAANHVKIPADIPKASAIHHAKLACGTKAAQRRAARNREIVRRAKLGQTNTQISRELNVSISTISRAISAAFRQP